MSRRITPLLTSQVMLKKKPELTKVRFRFHSLLLESRCTWRLLQIWLWSHRVEQIWRDLGDSCMPNGPHEALEHQGSSTSFGGRGQFHNCRQWLWQHRRGGNHQASFIFRNFGSTFEDPQMSHFTLSSGCERRKCEGLMQAFFTDFCPTPTDGFTSFLRLWKNPWV